MLQGNQPAGSASSPSSGSQEGEPGGEQEGAGPRSGNVSDGSLGGRLPAVPTSLQPSGRSGPKSHSAHTATRSLSLHTWAHLSPGGDPCRSPRPPSPALLYPCSPPTHCPVPGGRWHEAPRSPGGERRVGSWCHSADPTCTRLCVRACCQVRHGLVLPNTVPSSSQTCEGMKSSCEGACEPPDVSKECG